jgi:DUF4097 and DUF4098 domain-containing protein YvlB
MRTIVGLVLLWCFASGFAYGSDSNFEKKVAANPQGIVEISNVAGTIDVSGWDNAEVDVRAEMGGGVDRIDVSADSGRVTIKVIVPNHTFRSGSANLHVRVPRQSELDVSAVSADISTTDVEGRSQLKSVSGNIKADVFDSSAEIKSVSGDIGLRGRGKGNGMGIRVSTISGNIRIDRASGDLEATSVSGDLTVRLDPTRNIRVRTTSGDLGLEARFLKGGYLDAETVSGDLTLHAIPESGMDYEVNTFSGDIRDCMGAQPERASKYGPGQRLVGTLGRAGTDALRVRVKSMSGDVELCDKG